VEYCLISAGVGIAVFGAVELFKPSLKAIFANIAADGGYTQDQTPKRLNK
jgi:Flp pilus assembly pilin Flp